MIKVLESQLGYGSMVNYRYVRAIVMNRHSRLQNGYVEYCGLARHGWKIDCMLNSYGTYAYDRKLFKVNVHKKSAKIPRVFRLNVNYGILNFYWKVGICHSCYMEVVDLFTSTIIIEKHGQISRRTVRNSASSVFDALSKAANIIGSNSYIDLIG